MLASKWGSINVLLFVKTVSWQFFRKCFDLFARLYLARNNKILLYPAIYFWFDAVVAKASVYYTDATCMQTVSLRYINTKAPLHVLARIRDFVYAQTDWNRRRPRFRQPFYCVEGFLGSNESDEKLQFIKTLLNWKARSSCKVSWFNEHDNSDLEPYFPTNGRRKRREEEVVTEMKLRSNLFLFRFD